MHDVCTTRAPAPFWAGATPPGRGFSNCRVWPPIEVLSSAGGLGPRFSLQAILKGVRRVHRFPDSIDVKVQDGWITLTGEVSYQFESDAAYGDVADLVGVYGVTNEIKVTTP